MTRSRITLTADKEARIVFIRYIGDVDGQTITETSISQFSDIEQVWAYDAIFDLRRFDGVLLSSELQELGDRWRALANGRDAGRRSAIITSDPFPMARLPATRAQFPGRVIDIFSTFDEGLEWIKSGRSGQTAV
ncbi:MAG: hypothetical protein QM647_07945 [Asticcacaulis sp.]|uniref:hypothetical protein n=1 Tax=Asticcacaulis sp. TaxID=1872648 RepID=UPI0039E4513B